MADEQTIIKIEYDVDEAEKNLDDLALKIDGLTESNKQWQKQIKESRADLKKSDEQLAKENKTRDQSIRNLNQATIKLARNKDEISKVRKERNASIKSINGERSAFDKLTDAIEDSNKETKNQTKILGGLQNSVSGFGDKISALPGPIGGVTSAIGGMTKATLAFIATPLGAILAAIVGAVTLLVKAFKRSEGNMNKLKAVTGKLTGAFNGLMKMLEPVVEFIIDKAVKAFDALGTAVDKTLGFVQKGLKKLGFDKAAENVENFTNKIKESAAAGEELAKMEAELVNQLREQERLQLNFQKLAERQRQIRDDEAKSIQERIAANKELGRILQQQMKEELSIAQLQLDVANKRIELEGDTTANLDERAEALLKIAEIQERVEAQTSEQLVNINSLLKEQKELDAAKLESRKNTLEAIKLEDEARGISIEKEAERIAAEYQMKMDAEKALKEFKDEQAELEFMRDEMMLNSSFASMQEIISATQNMANQRVNIISDTFSRIATINFKEVKSAKDAYIQIGQAARGLTSLITSGNQAQLDDLAAEKQAELDLYGGSIEARERIESRFNKKLVAIKKAQAKEERKAAVINAIISTSLGVVKALGSSDPPLNFIMAGIVGALGGFQIATIRKQQTPEFSSDKIFARGGNIVDGPDHSGGGVNVFGDNGQFFGQVEGNEAMYVMKKDATAEIAAMSRINESHGGRSFFDSPVRHAQEGGQLDSMGVGRIVQDELQRTPVVVRVGDIETGMTDYNDTKQAGVI